MQKLRDVCSEKCGHHYYANAREKRGRTLLSKRFHITISQSELFTFSKFGKYTHLIYRHKY